jgi:hypothetical protein
MLLKLSRYSTARHLDAMLDERPKRTLVVASVQQCVHVAAKGSRVLGLLNI